MLLDSNIIIYAAQPEYADLRTLIAEQAPAVSAVSVVEVLGYHKLTVEARTHFEEFFAAARVLPISGSVITWSVRSRQQRRMTLGDALIAGTALTHGLTLVTRNADDFRWVPDLRLINPYLYRRGCWLIKERLSESRSRISRQAEACLTPQSR